jgi:elongation factor Ts
VPETVLASEKDIYAKQVTGKPANIVEKIVLGKLEKFYSQTCLVEQAFVKDPEQSVTDLLANKGKEFGDVLAIRRFTRFQVGVE